ncbi:MAG: 30S ribosomal protein S27e [Candidatus Ranarchaeia archaeon]|jgi:small subunit ribosomal protein S27e
MTRWTDLIPRPRSKFLRVQCLDCGNEQIVFSNAASLVKCDVCESILAEPRGGKATIHGEIINIYE